MENAHTNVQVVENLLNSHPTLRHTWSYIMVNTHTNAQILMVGATWVIKKTLDEYLKSIPGNFTSHELQVEAVRGSVKILKITLGKRWWEWSFTVCFMNHDPSPKQEVEIFRSGRTSAHLPKPSIVYIHIIVWWWLTHHWELSLSVTTINKPASCGESHVIGHNHWFPNHG